MGIGHFIDYARINSLGQPWGSDQATQAIYRASLIVTTSYVAGSNIDLWKWSQLIINVGITLGSLTSVQLKIEYSSDGGTTWYQETFGAVSGGTETDTLGEHSFTASGNYRLAIRTNDRLCRISVKGTGTVTSSAVSVDVAAGIN